MVRLSSSARKQYLDLIEHYLARGYDQAAERLNDAIDEALLTIGQRPSAGRDYPAVYANLVWPNVKWIKVHRYWFAYTTDGDPVIFNIVWDSADIPGRANPPG
jgi:plasmid stabilization system protein ParE